MTNGFNLNSSNEQLSREQGVDSTIIKVSETTVLTADAAEYGGNRTITQIRTNHQITTSDRLGVAREKGWSLYSCLSSLYTFKQFLEWKVVRRRSQLRSYKKL